MDRPLALVVNKDPAVRDAVGAAFERSGVTALRVETGAEASELLQTRAVRVLVLDVDATDVAEAGLVERAGRLRPEPLLIGLSRVRDGADAEPPRSPYFDCVPKPLDEQRLHRVVRRSLGQVRILSELERLRTELQHREGYDGIVGRSAAMQRLRADLERLAASEPPVWFTGEEGTGKCLAARTLHEQSRRRGGPFVAFHCSGASDAGWERQWTRTGGEGLLSQARGGTLYLEEVPELPLDAQRALAGWLERSTSEEGAPVGPSDLRLLAGSRGDPGAAVEEGRLLDSLHRRLGAFRLALPPLRERAEDIALLANHFIAAICEINRLPPIRISAEALAILDRYHWPGNVQELRNAVEHAVILASGGVIRAGDLPAQVRDAGLRPTRAGAAASLSLRPFREAKREVVAAFEQAYLRDLLERHDGNVTAAARQAGMLRSALQRLLRKYGLRSADFREARRGRRARRAATSTDDAS